MTICIVGYRVIIGAENRKIPTDTRRIANFDNYHDFGFDIFKAENWKNFLKNYKLDDGRKLPRKTKEGDKVAYKVYVWGKPKEWVCMNTRGSYLNLFPAYDEYGDARKVTDYGYID